MRISLCTRPAAAIAALTLCLVHGAALAEPGVTDSQIVLGSVTPVSGPPSLLGKAHVAALKVWQLDVNARGGINGRKVEIRLDDDGYVPQRALQGIKRLNETENIFGLIGTSGSAMLQAMLPYINEQKIPTINAMAVAASHFTPPNRTVFIVGPTYCQELNAAMVQLVKSRNLQKEKFALVYQDDDFGADVRCGYQKAVKALALNSVSEIAFKRGTKDFSAEMLSLKQAGATFLASGGVVAEHSMLMKEAAKNQMPLTILAVHSAHLTPVQALAGAAGDGYYVADYVPPLTDLTVPGMAKFIGLAQKHLSTDELKSLNRYSMTAYVGAMLMEDAIRRCGKALTRDCVVEKLETSRNFGTEGLASPIGFSPTARHSPSSVLLLKSDAKASKFDLVSEPIPIVD
ncbi:MAG: branched-chain amino acid ABC transporter substrate-binding protein [Variovorax paradoxus]|nr:MAG: branched-chain amino acid ABC transporter substrate-binding protein [Variovorax paradoxus]PZQ03639.1 MAG: branched-chain amino acid ABC transporter substrate-binding protein [Variovorax paradoxus]